ncbi:MAG: hypothetical protein IKX95_09440 [Lachnospiraceae bacterium]|nr:hypothetical protein [Lachnospiraceae bacterium]
MKRAIAILTAAILLLCALPTGLYAAPKDTDTTGDPKATEAAGDSKTKEEADKDETVDASDESETAETAEKPDEASPEDNIVTTKHSVVIKGQTIPYTAEAGTVTLESGGATCEMYYAAYTRDDVEDTNDRPITFAFNGGPGSSSYCIQFGCLGPRKAQMDDTGYAISLPAKIVDNENSVLDMTDLVFIDPVGTGYSRAAEGSDANEFYGYDNDIRSVGDFIRQYLNRNKRWGSKKYIAGESYGTTRAVGLCKYLADTYTIHVNGLMLVSSANNFSAIIGSNGNETPYLLFVPTYAAVAWYHGKLAKEYQDMELEEFLKEVRSFVEEEYVPAMFLGRQLSKDKKDEIAEKLSGYIGLSKDFVLKKNIRIDPDDFRSELLSDEKQFVGRYDGRIKGPATNAPIYSEAGDPSSSSTDIALVNAYLEYITEELGYETDTPFYTLSEDVNYAWSFTDDGGLISQEDIVSDCMAQNPFLKIWVLCSYFDGATPFYSAEWTYNHAFISEDREDNLSFTYYPSGHMFYVDKESFDKFRQDAEKWYE